MRQQYGWVSEYRRQKFLEGQRLRQEKRLQNDIGSDFDCPRTIAVMLDLDGTCDGIDDEKAQEFIRQLDVLRRKFGANVGTISISTHYGNTDKMKNVLDILSRNLSRYITIGTSFYLGGTYDYWKGEESFQGYRFNYDKVRTFDEYHVHNRNVRNQWFAIIDDDMGLDDIYSKYQNSHPMLVCRPSQSERRLSKNNFMSISTTTPGFDGVLEVFNSYINSVRDLSPIKIMETQQNMMVHLSSSDLWAKVASRDYAFLERYFGEGYADEDDYRDTLYWLARNEVPQNDELANLGNVLNLMEEHFQSTSSEKEVAKVLGLQKTFNIPKKK